MTEPGDQLIIDTPELISLEYPLAGVGSRSLALLFDSLLQFIAFLAIVLSIAYVGSKIPQQAHASNFDPHGWMLALLIFAFYALYWGYFALFELFWSGQTPGKRYMKIRVLHQTGRRLTAIEAIERNFLRVVDFLPGFYLLGAVFAALSRNKQRLGDLASGCVVVHEAPAAGDSDWYAASPHTELTLGEISRLGDDDFRLMEGFLNRRLDLPLARRVELGRRIAQLMARRLGVEYGAADDEIVLEELTRRWRDAVSYRAR